MVQGKHLLFSATAAVLSWCHGASGIDTVDSLVVSKYLGRWYQAYGNEFTAMTVGRDSTCIAADYALDEATGNITVINSAREHTPTGELSTITGYAYATSKTEPGQLKVHLGQVPVDGDYWIVGLGPETFGPDGSYEWAIVSGPEALSLFVLVRDVKRFDEMFADEVLELVESLGFTGPMKEPQRIVQEGCLPFDPTSVVPCTNDNKGRYIRSRRGRAIAAADGIQSCGAAGDKRANRVMAEIAMNAFSESSSPARRWSQVTSGMAMVLGGLESAGQRLSNSGPGRASGCALPPVETVKALDVERYVGRWYQAYSSYTVGTLLEQKGACVTADYSVNDDGTIAVTNTARAKGIDGELIQMEGYAYNVDDSQPGQLKVHLDGVPVDGPYWVLALGNEDGDGPYPWVIVSDPLRAFLFVLVRDITTFDGSDLESDLLKLCKDLGFTAFWNSPRKTVQEGCTYTAVATAAADGVADVLAEPAVAGRVELKRAPAFQKVKSLFSGPLHASCKLSWSFPSDDCAAVSHALVAAAKSMGGFDKCSGGNKCGYSVTDTKSTATGERLQMVHESSVKHYKDDLTIDLADEDDACTAKGFSTSETWYAVLDNSVNYCNLHNLVEASGLDYKESDVSDETCTQYSSADCERY